MKKSNHPFQSFLLIAIGCCAAVTVATLFFNIRLFYICAFVTVACAVLLVWQVQLAKRQISRFLVTMGQTLTTVQQDALTGFPIPVFVCSGEGEIVWCNRLGQKEILGEENCYGKSIYTILTGVDITRTCPEGGYDTEYKGRFYAAYVARAVSEEEELYMVYFFENTELKRYAREYFETRPSVMLILVDNYEELQQNMKDNERARVMGQIEYAVSKFVTDSGGLLLKTERDRFTAVMEERSLRGVISARFTLLEQVRAIETETKMVPTLSVGVGRDAATLEESERFARQALDMALGRGGDQAAVRGASGYEFFGGVSSGMEKRTKVKSRVMANALGELIADSSRVFVMGHKFPDLDCIGAITGVCAIARKRGVQARIIREPGSNPAAEMAAKLGQTPEYKDAFLSAQDAIILADPRTLLVVVDTNRPEQVQSEDLLECCTRVAVIDHHRRAASYIGNAALNFHEPYASSASELVTELIQYIMEPSDLLRIEAEALLAGMVLDTKNFTMRTGSRTFEAAAFLRRSGADTGDVRKLFQNDLAGTIARYDIIQTARMYHNDIAVAAVDHTVGRVTAAQAADELLNISGIDASFVLFPDADGERVIISARSMGNTNVQVVLEKLGGGGNAATAGAQVPSGSVEAVLQRLLRAIDQYFEED